MLRVAHVLNSPGRGGVPRVAHALVRHADPQRIAPHLFYLKNGSGPDLFEDMDIPRRVAKTASKASAITELVSFLDKHQIDILHTHSFRPNLYGRMAGAVLRPAGLKIVAHYHNDYSDKWDSEALLLERRLAAVTDLGLAVSGAVAASVSEQVGLPCALLENGLDRNRVTSGCRATGRSALKFSSDDFTIGLIGRICRQKGVDTFVNAALHIVPEYPAARFIVIGEGEDTALMAQLADTVGAAGLDGRIRFAGHREDMADILAALDLVVVPSRWEGFGLVLVEAMAAGVPVVASHVGGIPDVVGNAGLLIPPDDPAALSQAILSLYRDGARRERMRQAGLVEAARFDWSITAEKVAALYAEISDRQ